MTVDKPPFRVEIDKSVEEYTDKQRLTAYSRAIQKACRVIRLKVELKQISREVGMELLLALTGDTE